VLGVGGIILFMKNNYLYCFSCFFKKTVCLFSILIILLICIFSSTNLDHADAATGDWNDYTQIIAPENNGYYEISTPEQLAHFNKNMGLYKNSNIITFQSSFPIPNRIVY